MELKLKEPDAQLYSKFFVSLNDLKFANFYAETLLKKGWHYQPWERRWTTYQQQAAYTTALIVSYCRPFTKSYGWPQLPSECNNSFNQKEKKLHEQILKLRNTLYAHSDSANFSVRPWRSGDFSTDIYGEPALRLTKSEVMSIQRMINKIHAFISSEMETLLKTV